MAKLPNSFREKNRTTRQFRKQYEKLPSYAKEAVRASCVLFDRDPAIKSLRHHKLEDKKTGAHLPESWSVSATMQHRAIYVKDKGVNVWYWIGTHAEYDRFTGGK